MPSTQDAYLHVITGGFDEKKRKAVRKMFQGEATEEQQEDKPDPSNYDLIVGALEEIHAVGIKQFTIAQVVQILSIFEVLNFLTGNVDEYIERALAILGCGRHGDIFTIPDQNKLEAIRRQHCPDNKRNERLKSLGHQIPVAVEGSEEWRSLRDRDLK